MAKSNRSGTVALLVLGELVLVAAIVAVALGRRLPAVAEWVAQVPGGGLVVVGVAVVLLILAAIAMTVQVSS